MINRPDRVQIWTSQLAANNFPPICAMTGRPAETWHKFRFSTPPPWAYALLALVVFGGLGLIVGAIVMSAVAQKARGFLPLTRNSSRMVWLAVWIPAGLILGSFALWLVVVIAAFANVDATDANASVVAGILFFIGAVLLLAGLVGRLVIMPLVYPRGRVTQQPGYYDKLVEIRNVHPAFVAAVDHMHQTWAAQYAEPSPLPGLPQIPGSN